MISKLTVLGKKLLIANSLSSLTDICVKIMPLIYSYQEYADMIFFMDIVAVVPPLHLGINGDALTAIF